MIFEPWRPICRSYRAPVRLPAFALPHLRLHVSSYWVGPQPVWTGAARCVESAIHRVDRWNVAVVAVAAALPIVPLVMLEIPVAEILRRILGILA